MVDETCRFDGFHLDTFSYRPPGGASWSDWAPAQGSRNVIDGVYCYPRQHGDNSAPGCDICSSRTRHGQFEGKMRRGTAKAIVALAHPDFREDLERQAYENQLIPRGVSFRLLRNPSYGFEKVQHSR
jgi:hypothetical protein